MNALFLGGGSARHEAWIHSMADTLGAPFDMVVIQDYKHWSTGEKAIDIDYEVADISTKMSDLVPYVVYAKSIGTMVTLKAMYEDKIQPEACIFLGLPLAVVTDMNLPAAEWLADVDVPIYFLHNDNDPYGSADELKAFLKQNMPKADVTVLSGDTHDYLDTLPMATALDKARA